MNRQLRELVTLQELDALLDELGAETMREQERDLGFALGETTRLRAERARTAANLRPEILERYERVRQRHARAVVPTRGGVCLGCFTVRPSAMSSRPGGFETCERCGRILFPLAEPRPAAPAPAAGKPRSSR